MILHVILIWALWGNFMRILYFSMLSLLLLSLLKNLLCFQLNIHHWCIFCPHQCNKCNDMLCCPLIKVKPFLCLLLNRLLWLKASIKGCHPLSQIYEKRFVHTMSIIHAFAYLTLKTLSTDLLVFCKNSLRLIIVEPNSKNAFLTSLHNSKLLSGF